VVRALEPSVTIQVHVKPPKDLLFSLGVIKVSTALTSIPEFSSPTIFKQELSGPVTDIQTPKDMHELLDSGTLECPSVVPFSTQEPVR
jgi:hypothetical protein